MIRVLDEHHLQVGDERHFGTFHAEDARLDDDEIWHTRQFLVRYESKWSVSVIWGDGAYGDNHGRPWVEFPTRPFEETPTLVEAAVLHHDRKELQGNGGEPFAYLDADRLNALLAIVRMLGTNDELEVMSW